MLLLELRGNRAKGVIMIGLGKFIASYLESSWCMRFIELGKQGHCSQW